MSAEDNKFKVFIRRWWFPILMQVGDDSYYEVALALEFINKHKKGEK